MELNSTKEISWVTAISESGLEAKTVFFGNGPQPMQVAYGVSEQKPNRGLLKKLHTERKGNLPISLIVAVEHGTQVSMFGPDPDTDVLTESLGRSEAILNSVISQQSEILAYQRAMSIWRSKQTTEILGFTNTGLFASHYIRSSIGKHPNWKSAEHKSQQIVNLREKELLERLGFRIQSTPSSTLLLGAGENENRVVAILLEQNEQFDSKSSRLQASPVEWSLAIASEQGAPWVVAIKDSQIRLYPAKEGVGVGQKSQAETYFEIDLMMVDEENLGLLNLIFSAESLSEGGTVEQLLADSKKFAAELGVRLRERVYESVVPNLAKEIANQLRNQGHELDSKGLQLAYEITLRVLFRLLFQAYAEDRGLLPAGRNEIFDSNSMKRWSEHLLDRDPDSTFGDASSIWFDLMQIWDAIDQGNPDMQIPPYNGGLFGTDPELHPTGHLIRQLSIPDRVMGPALRSLVVDDNTDDGVPGAVDFRSLSVREFGTIYEGLLESSLSVADQDLTVDKKGAWVAAEANQDVLASKDEVYFHSASGERKSSGSYYTPSFVVDHLIAKSVEPALHSHLAKVKELLDNGDQAGAYKKFFDFRVADLAMGSAHFLVASIDKVEAIMRTFLLQRGNEIDGVSAELLRLESAAKEALGKDEAAYAEIERASLLRRQIARRCIYGLDINPLAVELARLAIWIHTFVPGLPMSSLEHNLVCANSLTGIGSVDEGLNALIPERKKGQSTLFDSIAEGSLNKAMTLLEDVASADEASKSEAKKAAETVLLARATASQAKMIFDLAVANRTGIISSGAAISEDDLLNLYRNEAVSQLISDINPAHMPYLFPEVFLRADPGFDCLVGNPPWEELTLEEPRFWLRVRPGLYGLRPQEMKTEIQGLKDSYPILSKEFEVEKQKFAALRSVISSGPFPGIGTGDVDLYKVFSWRNWELARKNGRVAIVVPKSLVSSAGSYEWRKEVFENSNFDLTYLINSGGWLFESVHAQYSIVLLGITKTFGVGAENITLNGPFDSLKTFFAGKDIAGELPVEVVKQLSHNYSIPVLADLKSIEVFSKFGSAERLDSTSEFRFAPVREFDATNDRNIFDSAKAEDPDAWKVAGGASFRIWEPDTGEVYAYADSGPALDFLQGKRKNQARNSRSAFNKLPPDKLGKFDTLEALHSRIAVRDVTNSVDYRTVIAALVPAKTFLTNTAPYLLRIRATDDQEAFLLGVLASLPLDWVARKFVVLHLNFHILNSLPIPKLSAEDTRFRRIVSVVGGLVSYSAKSPEWVAKLSVAPLKIGSDREKEEAISELDALIASSYELNEDDIRHIYSTFHKTWDFEPRLSNVIGFFREIETR